MDRVDTAEIGLVHRVLAAWSRPRMLPQSIAQRRHGSIKNWYDRQTKRAAAFFKFYSDVSIGQGKKHQSGIGADLAHDTIKMLLRPNHGPEMAIDLGSFELRQGSLGQHLQRFARGIRQKMKVEARHERVSWPCGSMGS